MFEPDRNLPNEILVHIFSIISQGDLTKVALVSHRFNAIAERVLYSSIDIVEQPTKNAPKRSLGWCKAMKRKQLYDIPRKLSIRWRIHMDKSKSLPHWCSLLNKNIRRLTLLDILELSIAPSSEAAIPALELIIRDLRLPNLRHCLLYGGNLRWPTGSPCCKPKPSVMCAFIAFHSGLRYLAVVDISESAVKLVPHDAVPELSIFYGSHRGAPFILPGRSVYHLVLTGMERDLSNENLSHMALTSVPLRILDLSSNWISPSVLRDIAVHLPTIEIFRVRLTLDRALTPIVSRPISIYFAILSWGERISLNPFLGGIP